MTARSTERSCLLDAGIFACCGTIGRVASVVQKLTFLLAGRTDLGRRRCFQLVPAVTAFPTSHDDFSTCHLNRDVDSGPISVGHHRPPIFSHSGNN